MPEPAQLEIENCFRAWQQWSGRYGAGEPEYDELSRFVQPGDLVLDVGANIGHYTVKLASIVGQTGRVIAIEPVPRTFSQLAAAVARDKILNVTLLNMASSDTTRIVHMSVPIDYNSLPIYYLAEISDGSDGIPVIAVALDDLPLSDDVSFVKIDVEGHELPTLRGMARMIAACHPVLLVEDSSPAIGEYLKDYGYEDEKYLGSPNRLFVSSANRRYDTLRKQRSRSVSIP